MATVVYVLLGVLVLLIIAYIFVPKAMLRFAEKNLIFQPPVPRAWQMQYGQGNMQEYMVDVRNNGKDYRIHTIFAPAALQRCNQNVLYCHGNASDLNDQQHIVEFYHDKGINVLLWDYSGYGKSSGTPSYEMVKKGVLAVFDWFKKNFDSKNVIVHGMSLGGAAAAYLAAHRPVSGLILESTFNSVASALTKGKRYTFFDEFCNDKCLGKLSNKVPVLIIHSYDDDVISVQNSHQLYNRLMRNKERSKSNTAFIGVHGGNHFNAKYSAEFWPEFDYLFGCPLFKE